MKNPNVEMVLRRITTSLSVVIITLTLVGVSTGVLLSFNYEPAAGAAYQSLKVINTELPYGWLFRKAHEIAGHGVIAIALIQIVVMFLGRQFRNGWLSAWISGIFLTLNLIGLAWTAMILGWNQEGYWRFNIELGTIQAIPFIGEQLRDIITGGAVSTVTVQHLYTIHSYILSITALILAVIHLVGALWQEKEVMEVGELQQPEPANS
ncbi:cytochrome b N-terminal domain-containing protein [Aetokthonos hydrillicola Thurmond2011]|jgi:cytochrome b6|uniref:Cytochrome b N-terminal domain-containing protein n=1 Tax=Aetokthonos hydrillicola Thurmond2011 TaxID=2712845 RepID=A0AAP5MD33_9CYAN|nr:cytochrome b N-terminal domain-containing protein [Aetokthonos hydrillicola]MBO3457901.1 cytochrome bc complex cytochrome b subunit [Aetokthonos hydrillicola CCALA 1050]MBW4587388.1 cytochrome b N-terminal domain-containing protein [Aetokthonos hydrillicola CCALA 1050]MDR9899957.1 cytochrome b N-terminal domain-containing protein [Aetokthonos hydrillicola Thurmond2011]